MSAPALEAVTMLAARQVLAAAADLLEKTYPAPRVTSVDVTRVVIEAADRVLPGDRSAAYHLACDALDALTAHRSALGEDPKALDRWSSVFARTEMVAQMRVTNAEQVPAVTRG
ncbi:hypothetical protein OG884_06245 [Streptosporangium sp. NBC_01755]|uniref:hypothetical protein n=1 Tax=Streptosporangium sp. NBC_01755 TaxID=2975949 RepID=UPI002DD9C989|nr:hypothetical protein [Streptosporangium sp. NBC_01755]WSD01528.1 hypothetical protein OG884_06245 [Streptosporangium sp. NBC_01755]